MRNDIVLYDFANSPCARRVKISLIEKGMSFDREVVNLSLMEQKTPEYLRINPNGLVPAMSHNGHTLFESSVICDYLEDLVDAAPLYPRSLDDRLAVRAWQDLELAMAKDYRTLMYAMVMGPLHHIAYSRQEFLDKAARASDNPAHIAWEDKIWRLQVLSPEEQAQYRKGLYQYVQTVEAALAGRNYLVAEQFSLADVATYPRLKMFPIVGIPLSAVHFPNIARWMARMEQRSSFASTQADEEKALLKISGNGMLALIGKLVYTPERQRSWFQRLLLRVIKPVLRRKLVSDTAEQTSHKRSLKKSQAQPTQYASKAKIICLSEAERERLLSAKSAEESGLVLYGNADCPESERLQWLLAGQSIPYRWVEGAPAEHDGPGQPALPLLIHGERRIANSLTIAEYLFGADSALSLFREQPLEQAKIRMWHAFDTGMHKELQPLKEGSAADSALYSREQGLAIIREKLLLLDEALSAGACLVGEAFSYADVALYSRMLSFERLGLATLIDGYQHIRSWMALCSTQLALWQRGVPKQKAAGSKNRG